MHKIRLALLVAMLLVAACAGPAPVSPGDGTGAHAAAATAPMTRGLTASAGADAASRAQEMPAPSASIIATSTAGGTSAGQPVPEPPQPAYWPTDGWRTSTPEQQGMDSEKLAQVFDAIRVHHANIHSVIVIRHGYMVTEAYFSPYRADRTHEVFSCTKSVISALIGIAIQEGHIQGVDQHMVDFFADRRIARNDARKQAVTLENLLTMTSGLDWPEFSFGAYDSQNPINQMARTRDWVDFVLGRPMAEEPGTRFNYNSGTSHLMSVILTRQTGMDTQAYADARLFKPLGISNYGWSTDRQGIRIGGWGLLLTPRDMAKFGFLYLHGGAWNDQQLVPAAWVKTSVQQHVQATDSKGYGYQWWIQPFGGYAAEGLGGQYIFVMPALDLIAVFTAEMGDDAPIFAPEVMRSLIIPAASPASLPANPAGVTRLQNGIAEATQPTP